MTVKYVHGHTPSMGKILVDNLQFEGPIVFGKADLPSVPALALVCTEAGEGFKIMSVVHGPDISKVIAESPKMDCWKKHAFHGNIDVYLNTDDMSEDARERFRLNAIEKRKEYIFCDEVPKIVDDW